MTGQRIFEITRKLVNLIFYLGLIGCCTNVAVKTYHLVAADTTLTNPPARESLAFGVFDVMVYGGKTAVPPYRFSSDKMGALGPWADRYAMVVTNRSSIGYYNFFLQLLILAIVIYTYWLLRAVFNSISPQVPFTISNANRIRKIGLLLILIDIVYLINYFLFNALAGNYFSGEKISLVTSFGGRAWLGLLILAFSVLFRRGAEIYSENQLTI